MTAPETAAPVIAPKRRGRPPKTTPADRPPIPETLGTTRHELDRILESFLGKGEVLVMRANGSYAGVFARYKDLVQQAHAWEQQATCPHCLARPGYNPLTGVWVRSWDANRHEWIEGHYASCKTLAVRKEA